MRRWPALLSQSIRLLAILAALAIACPRANAQGTSAILRGTIASAGNAVSGATVTLFAAGADATSVLGSALSDQQGDFEIQFLNPGGSAIMYAIARGGELGNGPNSAIAMLAVLGTASSYVPFAFIDEVTTVASVWSMAQFIHDDGSIFGPSPGLQNAAATVIQLADLATGQPAYTVRQTWNDQGLKLISLANILVPCADSSGRASAACAALFHSASGGSRSPRDTLAAAVNIAQHPAANATSLFRISQGSSAYGRGLRSNPGAWTVSITYYGAAHDPWATAIDSQGNVWIADVNEFGGLVKFTPGTTDPYIFKVITVGNWGQSALAIDRDDHVWSINDSAGDAINEVDSQGNLINSVPFAVGRFGLTAIAIDPLGNVWATDDGNFSLEELNPAGQVISPPGGFTGGGINSPVALAISKSGTKWIANDFFEPQTRHHRARQGSVSAFDSSGQPISEGTGFTGGGIAAPNAVAVDGLGNAWISDFGYHYLGRFDPGGATKFNGAAKPVSAHGMYQGGGTLRPIDCDRRSGQRVDARSERVQCALPPVGIRPARHADLSSSHGLPAGGILRR